MSDFSIDIDDKKDTDICIYIPHNGKPITKIEISPDESYLVTYSEEVPSIVGWNVGDVDEEQLKQELSVDVSNGVGLICVSNDKRLVYTDNDGECLGR
jgi:hypothetical protein